MINNSKDVFLELLRAGLWENHDEFHISGFKVQESVDWDEVYRLAEEQSVTGVVLAGIEHSQVKPPQELLLQWIGEVQILEQQNKAMNEFVAKLIEDFHKKDIYALLVKGQGVAQCYERPLWRTSGDIDLLLDDGYYEKAKALLIPLADEAQNEDIRKKHQAIIIKGFDIELHGKMPFGLSRNADKILDEVIEDVLKRGGTRVWTYNNSDIYLPSADNDVILVFTHFLRHFFIEGVGLRQICDWCRLLWTYRDSLKVDLLKHRIQSAGLMSEWQVFGALAVDYLAMPEEAIPFYKGSKRQSCKAKRVLSRVIKSGNFGHNKDLSYRSKYKGLRYKVVALRRRLKDFIEVSLSFPMDGPRFFMTYIRHKI